MESINKYNEYFGLKKEQYDKLLNRIMFDNNFPLHFEPPPQSVFETGKIIKQMIDDKIIKSISINPDQTLNIIYY